MHIRIIFLFAISLFNNCLLHSNTGFSHFYEYTGNIFAYSAPPVIASICAMKSNESSDTFTRGVFIAGTLFFGSIPAYKIIECIKQSKGKERHYLFKQSLNTITDIVLILTSYIGIFDNHPTLFGSCLAGYITKYLVYNRPKKEVIAIDAQ